MNFWKNSNSKVLNKAVSTSSFGNIAKWYIWQWFKKVAGISLMASLVMWITASIDVANAYKEYSNMTVKQAMEAYPAASVELLQWVKVFGETDSFEKYGLSKAQMQELDRKASEYTSKTGNFVWVSIFGKNSGCTTIQDCKELNMKVKWLSDNGVAILVMDTGVFGKNISVVADPAIKDFFDSNDEQYVINNMLKPSLKSATANDGINKGLDYIMRKLGSEWIATQRVQLAEQAKQDQLRAQEAEKQNALILEANAKQTEENNKKMKELMVTSLKYILMLFWAIGTAYVGKKVFDRARIVYKKKSLFSDLDNLEVTEKVLDAMKKSWDITQDEQDKYYEKMNKVRSKIQNLDFNSYANDKVLLSELWSNAQVMVDLKSTIDGFISEVSENKKNIDWSLVEAMDSYEAKLTEATKVIWRTETNGISNIEDMKDKAASDIKEYTQSIEKFKKDIQSDTNLTLVEKREFLDNIDTYLDKIVGRVDDFINDVNEVVKKDVEHKNNQKKISDIKSEDL